MRISDWSSDVCSSDLVERKAQEYPQGTRTGGRGAGDRPPDRRGADRGALGYFLDLLPGYRGAQMGPALSDPRLLLPAGGEHGRPGAAGAGAAAGAADRGRAQLDRPG